MSVKHDPALVERVRGEVYLINREIIAILDVVRSWDAEHAEPIEVTEEMAHAFINAHFDSFIKDGNGEDNAPITHVRKGIEAALALRDAVRAKIAEAAP